MRTIALDKDRIDDCFVCDSKHHIKLTTAYGEYVIMCHDGCVDDTDRPQPLSMCLRLDDAIEHWNEIAAAGREHFDTLRNDPVRIARQLEWNRACEDNLRRLADKRQTKQHIDSKTKP